MTKCAGANGLAAIRSLGRAGLPVYAVDYGEGALGFYSRYARPWLCPDPMHDAGGFIESLIELSDWLGVAAPIFPTNDEALNAVAQHRSILGDRYLYPFPDWDLLEPIQNKLFQIEQAQAHDIPTPRTATEPTDEFGYPVLVKPSDPAGFQREYRIHSFICEDDGDMLDAFDKARPFGPLVQEFIPGGDTELYTFGAYVNRNGVALGIFSGKKDVQYPAVNGTCRIGRTVWVDEVVEQGLRYLSGLGYTGLAQVEFKRDPRDGLYKLMEINPRLWQWHGLASASGVDFPTIAYDDLVGLERDPQRSSGARRWAMTMIPGVRPAFARPPYVDAVAARDDLRPLMHTLLRSARSLSAYQASRRRLRLRLDAT